MKYRKKPIVIEAYQFDGTVRGAEDLSRWIKTDEEPSGYDPARTPNGITIVINTLEGDMKAGCGDWIIKGVNGEFYPCKNDIFSKTYELQLLTIKE